jgi:uncharacterized protein (DUF2141 family)
MRRLTIGLAAVLASSPPAAAASLEVAATGFASNKGQAVICLWKAAQQFPDCDKGVGVIRQTAPINGTTATVRFADLAPGDYAVSVLHDADANGRLKTNFIGMPIVRQKTNASGVIALAWRFQP